MAIKPCRCSGLIIDGICNKCGTSPPKGDEGRKSSRERGYSTKWDRYTRWRRRQPEHAICVLCEARGRIRAAAVVDHIEPCHDDGGNVIDSLFWDKSNHQDLCKECHDNDKQIFERATKRGTRKKLWGILLTGEMAKAKLLTDKSNC